MKNGNRGNWNKRPTVTHNCADLSEHQQELKARIEADFPQLKEILVNGYFTELTDDEIRLLDVNSEMNPYVVLGICSKYKLGKRLGKLKTALGQRYYMAISTNGEVVGTKTTNDHAGKGDVEVLGDDDTGNLMGRGMTASCQLWDDPGFQPA